MLRGRLGQSGPRRVVQGVQFLGLGWALIRIHHFLRSESLGGWT